MRRLRSNALMASTLSMALAAPAFAQRGGDHGGDSKPDRVPAAPSTPVAVLEGVIPGDAAQVRLANGNFVSATSVEVEHGKYASSSAPACINVGGEARCAVLSVTIPKAAHIVAVRTYAREVGETTWHECRDHRAAGECIEGWAGFGGSYHQDGSSAKGQMISWLFKNWSHNRYRQAKLEVEWYQ